MTKRLLRAIVPLMLLLLVTAVPALAATRHGITPKSPKKGATVPVGKAPTFSGKVRGKGAVWVYVCRSPKRDAKGVICDHEMVRQARRRGNRFTVRPKFFDFPEFWLNTPGTYYWQAHRMHCEGNTRDCLQEGPVVRFKVG